MPRRSPLSAADRGSLLSLPDTEDGLIRRTPDPTDYVLR